MTSAIIVVVVLEQAEARRRIRSPWGRAAVLLGLVGVLAAALYWATLRRSGFPWDAVVWWVVVPSLVTWLVGGPRRAVRVNSDPGSPDDQQGAL